MLYFVFLTTFLLITSFSFFKLIGTGFNLSTPKSFTFVFNLFKPAGALANLSISNLSTLAFKTIKSLSADILDVSTPAACSNYFLVSKFVKPNTALTLFLTWLSGSE